MPEGTTRNIFAGWIYQTVSLSEKVASSSRNAGGEIDLKIKCLGACILSTVRFHSGSCSL